jgi:hypothetical protein
MPAELPGLLVGIGGLAVFDGVTAWQADNAMAAATDRTADWRTEALPELSGDRWAAFERPRRAAAAAQDPVFIREPAGMGKRRKSRPCVLRGVSHR